MLTREVLNARRRKQAPTEGRYEATFNRIKFHENKETGEIYGLFVETTEYTDQYIKLFEDRNLEFDNLLAQLGNTTFYNEDEINAFAGTKIIFHVYKKDQYTNTSFNPNWVTPKQNNFA